MRFWCRCSELIETAVTDSLIIRFHWSRFTSHCNELTEIIEADLLRLTKRNETQIFLFGVLSVDLFVRDKWFDVCVWLLFLSLSSDVSTLKKASIVEIIRCRRTERRSTIEMCRRFEEEDRQLTSWLIRRTRRSTIDLLIEFSLLITMSWLIFRTRRSTIDCHYRWLTMRQVKVRFNHRFQRENFFINADLRSFSLIHDAHSESEMHSSSAKAELHTLTILFWLAYFYERSDDFL